MRYYAEYNADNELIAIGMGSLNGVEITQEEYATLSAEIQTKADYAEQVYTGEITIDDVPEEYRADVQAQVDALIEAIGPYNATEISAEEALNIILGGEDA